MDKTLIVSDLDGTLLNDRQEISSLNAHAIREFKSLGGLFTFATGRMEKAALPYIRQLDINVPVILYNGAKIFNPLTNEFLYENFLKVPTDVWGILEEYITDDIGVLIYQNSEVITLNKNSLIEAYEKKERLQCKAFNEVTFTQPVTKILIISPSVKLLKKVEQRVALNDWLYEIVYSEPSYLEILPNGVSKGIALKRLIEYLQIINLRTIAVGDHLNDISLLKQADIGYAVGNANALLKKVADKITVDNSDHAIANIICEQKQIIN